MQLAGHIAHRALEQKHALAVEDVHDLHFLVLGQARHIHRVGGDDGGDDAGGGAGDGGGIAAAQLILVGVVVVGDEAGAALHAGGDETAAQIHHAACQLLIAAGVEVDTQKACQLAVGALDEHTVGAHFLAVGGGGLKAQHIVLGLIHAAGHEGQHLIAQGGS